MERSVLFCVLFLCSCYYVFAGAPEMCDGVHGSLQTVPVFTHTYPGSSHIVNLQKRGPSIGSFSFYINGTCNGGSYLRGLAPAAAYIRQDGTPWESAYEFRLSMYDPRESYIEVLAPTSLPWVISFFGFDGYCDVEVTVRYCECNAGYLGPHCQHQKAEWGNSIVPAYNWNYHCIPQDEEQLVVERYNISFTTASPSAVLSLYTRWGAAPLSNFFQTEAFIVPPQQNYDLNLIYPRYEHGKNQGTECFWVGIFNPTPTNTSYFLNYTENVCKNSYGASCEIVVPSLKFGQSYNLETKGNWTYLIFDPQEITSTVQAYEFILNSNYHGFEFFVRRDGPPTHFESDARTFSNATLHRLWVEYPRFGLDGNTKWWIGIYNENATSAPISFSVNATASYCWACSSPGGHCQTPPGAYPLCVCSAKHAGYDCSEEVQPLYVNASSSSFTVTPYHTNYYSIELPAVLPDSPILHVSVHHASSSTDVQFYLQKGRTPSTYQYYSTNREVNFTLAVAPPDLQPHDVWYLSATEMKGINSSYVVHAVIDSRPPTPPPPVTTGAGTTGVLITTSHVTTTTTSSTGYSTSGVPSSTTGSNDAKIIYKLDGGAAAGLAISMIFVGALIGVGAAWFWVRTRRGGIYASLKSNANFL